MMTLGVALLGLVLVLLGVVFVVGLVTGYRNPRWRARSENPGVSSRGRNAGAGPYRSVTPTPAVMPASVAVLASSGFLWGAATCGLFAPAGGLLTAVAFEGAGAWAFGFGAVSLLGALLGLALMVASLLAMHRRLSPGAAAALGAVSLSHHALVLGWLMVGLFVAGVAELLMGGAMAVAVVLCLIGAGHAALFAGILPARLGGAPVGDEARPPWARWLVQLIR